MDDEIEVRYFANGRKRSEGAFRNGKKHGSWTLYYPNGNKMSEATFHEGLYTGLYTAYYENGNKKWQGRYNDIRGVSSDGTKDGEWLVWEPDGTLRQRITYKRGSKVKTEE